MMPFFKEGYDRGEKLFHIVDSRLRDAHVSACRECGIDVDSAQASGQLEVRNWEDAYLKDGYFDGDRMVRILEDVLESNRAKYGQTRLMGNMEWSLETAPGVTDIVEYETKLNLVLPKRPRSRRAVTTALREDPHAGRRAAQLRAPVPSSCGRRHRAAQGA
jgi:hypothetical protein